MILVVALASFGALDVVLLAETLGVTVNEARLRVAGDAPHIIAVEPDDTASALVARMRVAGLPQTICLPLDAIDTDARRRLIDALSFGDDALRVQTQDGASFEIAYDVVALLVHGLRARPASLRREESVLRSTGRAFVAETATSAAAREAYEPFLYLYADDHAPALALYANHLFYASSYASLDDPRGAASDANFTALVAELRHRMPHAEYDERLLHPPSLALIPPTPPASDANSWPFDLATTLVSLALFARQTLRRSR